MEETTYTEPSVPANEPRSFRVRAAEAFRSPLFLTAAILASVALLFSSFSADPLNGTVQFQFNIIGILMVIGFWVAYANASKNFEKSTGTSILSGTVKTTWILLFVSTALVLLIGVAFSASSDLIAEAIKEAMEDPQFSESFAQINEMVGGSIMDILGIFFYAVAVVIAGSAVLVLLFWKFTKSICVSLESDSHRLGFVRYARVMLLIVAIFSTFGLIGMTDDPMAMVSSAGYAAMCYVLFAWVRRFSLQVAE